MPVNDQESLIPGKEGTQPCINPIAFYIILQFLPFVTYVIFIILRVEVMPSAIITLSLLAINFWFVQNVHGIQLVGLRWKFSISAGFDYFSKPDPFVPQAADSNAFWVGFFAFIILWAIAFIVSLFVAPALQSATCLIGSVAELMNLLMFMRAHKTAKLNAEHAALEILQDEQVNFELVKDDTSDVAVEANSASSSSPLQQQAHNPINQTPDPTTPPSAPPSAPPTEPPTTPPTTPPVTSIAVSSTQIENPPPYDSNSAEEPVNFELVDENEEPIEDPENGEKKDEEEFQFY